MKAFYLPILSAILLGGSIRVPPITPVTPTDPDFNYADDFDYLVIPPFKIGEEQTIYYAASFSKANSYTITFNGKYSFSANNYTYLATSTFLGKGYKDTVTFSHPFDISGDTIEVEVIILQGRVQIYREIFETALPDTTSIATSTIQNYRFQTKDCIMLYEHGNEIIYTYELYSFTYVNTLYALNNGFVFDPSKLRITYKSPRNVDFKSSAGTIYLSNYKGLFSDLPHSNGLISIPINTNINARTGAITFSFKNTYYVHPVTLKMSSEAKEGYIKTGKFYFPREFAQYGENFYFTYYLGYVGCAKNPMSISYRFAPGNNIFDLCGLGTYCVNSNGATPNFEIGATTTHD